MYCAPSRPLMPVFGFSFGESQLMRTKSDPKLIYDVGMHNGDDTAYYLWRGFRVVAIEPNPELVATAANRFRREIEAGNLKILNVGMPAENGQFHLASAQTDSALSSF